MYVKTGLFLFSSLKLIEHFDSYIHVCHMFWLFSPPTLLPPLCPIDPLTSLQSPFSPSSLFALFGDPVIYLGLFV